MSTALIMGKAATPGIDVITRLIGSLAKGDHNGFMMEGAAAARVTKTTGAYLAQQPLANPDSTQLCKPRDAFRAAHNGDAPIAPTTAVGPWGRRLNQQTP